MKGMKTALGVAAALLVVLGGFYYTQNAQAPAPAGQEDAAGKQRAMSVEQYVRDNISAFSPKPEVLGGTFYVTKIAAANGAGTVEYEDGHNAYTADFTYTVDERGAYSINSFVLTKEN